MISFTIPAKIRVRCIVSPPMAFCLFLIEGPDPYVGMETFGHMKFSNLILYSKSVKIGLCQKKETITF